MHEMKLIKTKKQISKYSFQSIPSFHFKLLTSSILNNNTKQACSSFITLVNSSSSAWYDSYVDGSSNNGLNVLAKGRQCCPSRTAKCTSMLCTYSDHITTSADPEKRG